jgi:hypothetical protein
MNKHLFLPLALVCVLFSCSDDSKDPEPEVPAEVSFVEPGASVSAYAGQTFDVKIKNFSTSKHVLSLNGVQLTAQVLPGSDYSIARVTTPPKVGSGRLVLTNGDQTQNGPAVNYVKQYYGVVIMSHLYHGTGLACLPNDRILVYDPEWSRLETMRFEGFSNDENGFTFATVRSDMDLRFDGPMYDYPLIGTQAKNGGVGMTVDRAGDLYFFQRTGDYQTHQLPERRNILTAPASAVTAGPLVAEFYHPETIQDEIGTVSDLESDSKGNLYAVLTKQKYIQKIANGVVTKFVGSTSTGTADGTGANAQFSLIQAIAIDGQDNLYVADSNRVRQITPAGVVTTLAGSTQAGSVDGTLSEARFNYIATLTAAPDGTLFLFDRGNKSVRIISADRTQVSTMRLVGVSQGDKSFEPGPYDYNLPMTIDSHGNVYLLQSAVDTEHGQIFHALVPEDNIPNNLFEGLVYGSSTNYVAGVKYAHED